MTSHLRLLAAAAWALALVSGSPAAEMPASETETVAPSPGVAAERGPQIFNTVFDSLRKWGAVTHRNGMSFMLATVPKNVLLYHGNDRNATPTTLDWLAYEIEHAEMFARANQFGPPRRRPGHGGYGHGGGHWEDEAQDDAEEDIREDLKRRSFEQGSPAEADDEPKHGWLHVYRTTRPLRFLYIDGMSGDKDSMGVLDTQDYLLRGVRDEPTWPPRWPPKQPPKQPPGERTKEDENLPGVPGEQNRVRDICQMCADWNLQGVIRTEWLGFEIIKCDFFDGMDHVQSLQRDDENPDLPPWFPQPGQPFKPGKPWGAYLDLADRFREVNPGRTILDYSSIVSAYFFPVNITNPDEEHAERPRLLSTTEAELATIKKYLSGVIEQRRDATTTDASSYEWRYVADDIVHRYTPKILSILNSTSSADDIAKDVRFLLEAFIDYSIDDVTKRDSEAEKRCTAFYLQTLPRDGDAELLLYSAFEAVSAEICASLFKVRKLIAGKTDVAAETLEAARSILGSLVEYLAWHVFENDAALG